MNILAQAGNAGGIPAESLLEDPAGWVLWQGFLKVQPEVHAAQNNHDCDAELRALASMQLVIDECFKEIMVLVDDPAIRTNRVALLHFSTVPRHGG